MRSDSSGQRLSGEGAVRPARYPVGMVELRVLVSDELAEQLARRAREQHTTAEQLASSAVESLYGHTDTGGQAHPGFVALGSSGRSDVSERSEEILRAELGE